VAAGLNQPNPPYEPAPDQKGGIYVLSPEGKLLSFLPVPAARICERGSSFGRSTSALADASG
jgi:hypothetical protein